MHPIKVKKLVRDHLIGSGLVFLLIIILIGNTSVFDTSATFDLAHKCSLPFAEQEVMQNVQQSLKDGEFCKLESPCEGTQTIRCEGTVEVYEVPGFLLVFGSITHRVKKSIHDAYGVYQYKTASKIIISHGLLVLFAIYSMVLTEAGAVFFALWRQRLLGVTFDLPAGSKIDQLLLPGLFAVILASAVIVLNQVLFAVFDHSGVEQPDILRSFFQTLPGIFFLVLIAPLLEELMFRGVFLRAFIERNRLILGTVVVSLVFSLVHGFSESSVGWQLYMSSVFFLVSSVLCWLYITKKNLWSPIIFHGTYNGTMVIGINLLS